MQLETGVAPDVRRATSCRSPRERGGGAVLVLHDITDLRRADQVRRDFVANVSHELRTPLTAIRGYVEALLDSPDRRRADAAQFLEIIARHALRMERLVSDLLRLARLDAGQETLELARLLASPTIFADGRRTISTRLLASRGQHVQHHRRAGRDAVSRRPRQAARRLRNLLENASNYSPEGGVIELVTRRAIGDWSKSPSPTAARACPKRICPASSSASTAWIARARAIPAAPGSGLSIVRHLVELHGGTRDGRQSRRRRRHVRPCVLPAAGLSTRCTRSLDHHANSDQK